MFVGPFDHHSNILPWRESCADVVQIAENAAGGLDVNDLKLQLKKYSGRRLKIGKIWRAAKVAFPGSMSSGKYSTRHETEGQKHSQAVRFD